MRISDWSSDVCSSDLNMAMLCCHSAQGEMFLMTRYPDENELEIALEGEPSTLEGVKVTLSPTLLKIEIAAADADVLHGDDVLDITHDTDAADLAEEIGKTACRERGWQCV